MPIKKAGKFISAKKQSLVKCLFLSQAQGTNDILANVAPASKTHQTYEQLSFCMFTYTVTDLKVD